jgi:hypothetical protein
VNIPTYSLYNVCKSSSTNMEMVQNFDVISGKFNVSRILLHY